MLLNLVSFEVFLMKKKSFRRGIHPPDLKMTAEMPISRLEPKAGAVMIYPMVQHIGAPCTPTVAVGDIVAVGQKIGDREAVVSSPIHSAVSGKVVSIGDALTPKGETRQAVFIENDGQFSECPSMQPPGDYKSMSREDILAIIRQAGVVGLGGAGFPTHVKLNTPEDKPIDTIFVNAAECEPYLTTDHRILLEETEKILAGLDIVLHMFPEARGIIAIEDNKPDAIEKFKQVNHNDRVQVMPLATKYPQGGEKQIIYACTGREVPSGALPMDVGCIVHNTDTIAAIRQAVIEGRPLMRKVVTVTGGAAQNPGNYEVRLGMTFKDLLEEIGGTKQEPHKIVVGGPMMGVAQSTLEVPIIKTSAAIILMTEQEAKRPPEQNCFRCGKCVDHCPVGLIPLELNTYASRNDTVRFKKYHGMDCMSCACCSYVCPAHRHVAQGIGVMKQQILNEKR
jgi:electron transport complex protein RnfC